MDKIKLYSTEEGKLYIKPSELFALPHVQELILRIANKEAGQNKQDVGKNEQLVCDVCESNRDEKQVKIFEVEKNGWTYFEVMVGEYLAECVFFGDKHTIKTRQEALARAVEIAKACKRPDVRTEVSL